MELPFLLTLLMKSGVLLFFFFLVLVTLQGSGIFCSDVQGHHIHTTLKCAIYLDYDIFFIKLVL